MVLVPEAEGLVGPFRQLYDPAAAVGVPAHITINYPFLPAVRNNEFDTQELVQLFGVEKAFAFSLASVRNFPSVLYLAPEPPEPFAALIEAVERRYPDSPPYGGVFEAVVPHLTIADVAEPEDLPSIRRRFVAAAVGRLPIAGMADQVWLMDNRPGRWRIRESYPLRG